MCIGNYCAHLTPEEQRAQHNFEERKGPYPLALATRLEVAGIMTREEHLARSIVLINKNAIHGFKWGDCAPAEKDYIEGRLHAILHDQYLTPENQAKIHKMAREERRAFFNRNVGKKGATIVFFAAYPECGQWISELLAIKAVEAATMARKLAVKPALLGQLAPAMGEKSLTRLAFDLAVVCGFYQNARFSDNPVLSCLGSLANQVGATRSNRCDIQAEIAEIRRLNERATEKFQVDRAQQRRSRRDVRKQCSRKLNLLRNEFYKRPDAMAIMARVVRELKTPVVATLPQAA